MMDIDEQYLELAEELETLRAENADLKLHKEYDQTLDQLIIERDKLLEDNAKLIAERDGVAAKLYDHIKHGDDDHKAWLKHELEVFFGKEIKDFVMTNEMQLLINDYAIAESTRPLYAHPLPAQHEERLGTNHYGLDMGYFVRKLNILIRDIRNYKPDEAARTLARLAKVADEKVLIEPEFLAQQIPEGYALEWHDNHLIVTAPDNGQGLAYADETLYQFIKAMLSASQPKGDV